jgi:K+-transporting ATPase KdpF subunit
MLPWVVGGSNVHDGPHAIRDCRFLSPDVRSGEIRRERHRQGAAHEITRHHSFRHKREREIPLNDCAFWRNQRSRLKEAIMVAVYLLALIVVFLVAYLFYAVINPERF